MPSYTPNQITKDEMIEIIREKMLSQSNNITENQRKKFKKSLSPHQVAGSNVKDFLVDLLLTTQNRLNHLEYEFASMKRENERLENIIQAKR
tara:strand:- start:815 stop:1090 length:276 start_codon:yes stop_codon:yes gene_type:complete